MANSLKAHAEMGTILQHLKNLSSLIVQRRHRKSILSQKLGNRDI